MKLKEYVPVYAQQFASFNPHDLCNYISYVRKNFEYNSLENCILWELFRRVNRVNNYMLYDEMRINYPGVNDSHILTMLKAAFKMCFGSDVETFVNTAL